MSGRCHSNQLHSHRAGSHGASARLIGCCASHRSSSSLVGRLDGNTLHRTTASARRASMLSSWPSYPTNPSSNSSSKYESRFFGAEQEAVLLQHSSLLCASEQDNGIAGSLKIPSPIERKVLRLLREGKFEEAILFLGDPRWSISWLREPPFGTHIGVPIQAIDQGRTAIFYYLLGESFRPGRSQATSELRAITAMLELLQAERHHKVRGTHPLSLSLSLSLSFVSVPLTHNRD